MTASEINLVCEGEPEGIDIRWLGLALDTLRELGAIDVLPSGSKANLKPTIEGLRRLARGPSRFVAIRDRDFLTADLLDKDLESAIYPLRRHCLESYLVEPSLIEDVFPRRGVAAMLAELAEARVWKDIARAVLDDFAYRCRSRRPSVENELLHSKEVAVRVVSAKILDFPCTLPIPDVAAMVDRFETDMRADPLWTRVDGKELLKALEKDLREARLLSGTDLEGRLFAWCVEKGAPAALAVDVKHALERLGVSADT